jgi:selenobiotic family peptide radical SAM maturase
LGNPAPLSQIEELLAIAKPEFFQVSLEGLEAHNDAIRVKGHFARTLAFLEQLHELGICTMVMLTLSRDNLDQVLPLAKLLKDRTDFFTFNRLSAMGQGAQLSMVPPETFENFLEDYEAAALENPTIMLKDNLINLIRNNKGVEVFGGCTGYGCGAAFNFVALLSDGEVHACRKFPSLIGNINADRLVDIYQSELAQKYRDGSAACRDCTLNIVCRGCLAVVYSCGLDVFRDKDPYCFQS